MSRLPFPRSALLLALATTAAFSQAQAQTFWYVEEDGVIAFDIEAGPELGNWTVLEGDGSLGSGYLRWDGAYGGPDSSEGRRLRYRFVVSEPGNYELRWRSKIDKGDESSEHNDSWVRFPTGIDVPEEQPLPGWTKVYMNDLGRWSWRTATVDFDPQPLRQFFAAGQHEFEIAARSDGHAIDRVVLVRYETNSVNDSSLASFALSSTTTDPDGVADASGGTTGEPPEGGTGGDSSGGATTGGEGDAGQTDGTEDGSDDGSADGGTTDAGTTDAGATEGGQPSAPLQKTGTCEADRLVLATSGESGSDDAEENAELKAGIDGQIWLAFDLTDVPPVTEAVLRITPLDGNDGSRTLVSWLGSTADVSAPPDPTVAVGASDEPFDASGSVALTLDSSLLAQSSEFGIGVGFNDQAQALSITASTPESQEERPALELAGEPGFCEEWDRLSSIEEPVKPEIEQEATPEPVTEPTVPVDKEPEAGTTDGGESRKSGGGTSMLMVMLLGALRLARKSR